MPPAEFLAIAEESGLIMTISDWVLKSAFEAAEKWHHGAWPDVRVAINVSARQLLDSQFVDRIWHMLRQRQAASSLHRDRADRERLADRPCHHRNATSTA